MENRSIDTYLDVSDDIPLWNLNLQMLRVYTPAAAMVLCLQMLGIPGNSLVIYVYHVHFRKTTANLFIKVLAVLDVACCIFGMSYELVDLCFSVMNGEKFSCKIFRGIEQSLEFISGEILLCIALDRYMHICKPLAIYTIQRARQLAFACLIVGILVSTPTLILIGPAEVYVNDIKTRQCTFDDDYKNSTVKVIYYICLNAITGITFITMIVLYIRIWYELCQWQRSHVGESVRPTRKINERIVQSEVFKRSQQIASIEVSILGKICTTTKRATTFSFMRESYTESAIANKNLTSFSKLEKLKRKRLVKPVMILFFVTLVFVLSFLPYFTLMLLHSAGIVEPNSLEIKWRQIWEMAYKSYFLSNALNPLIYAAFDKNFRTICYNVLFLPNYRRGTRRAAI